MNAPNVAFLNQSLLLVSWDHPARPSGLLDYYEVNITHPGGDNTSSEIRETFSKEFILIRKLPCILCFQIYLLTAFSSVSIRYFSASAY